MSTAADSTTVTAEARDMTSPEPNVSTDLSASPKDDTPLGRLSARLGEIISRAEYNEMYGVALSAESTG